jgi:hypothetical protein
MATQCVPAITNLNILTDMVRMTARLRSSAATSPDFSNEHLWRDDQRGPRRGAGGRPGWAAGGLSRTSAEAPRSACDAGRRQLCAVWVVSGRPRRVRSRLLEGALVGTDRGHGDLDASHTRGDEGADLEQRQPDRR